MPAAANYFCAYHSVAYFVFRQELETGITEPILEVTEQAEGVAVSQWLNRCDFVGNMLITSANDNE